MALKDKVKPMGNVYEIYALRYATMSRTPHMNYLTPDPHETAASDLDYFVWLIRGGGRDILVDTGFNAAEASLRNRKLTASRMWSSPICITTMPAISIAFPARGFICRTAR